MLLTNVPRCSDVAHECAEMFRCCSRMFPMLLRNVPRIAFVLLLNCWSDEAFARQIYYVYMSSDGPLKQTACYDVIVPFGLHCLKVIHE